MHEASDVPAADSHQSAPHEERRLVTILFADVVGSTSLGEALDPEDVRALLARMFSIGRDAIERHGGLIEKFIGDAVMAVFGLPIAHDDDSARALSAALEFRDRVRADPVLADRVAIRLGVNTGEVIAAPEAGATGPIVVGDAVNTAARLEQGAETWAILAGERTVRASGDRFDWGEPVELAAKGKAQPVVARPLTGVAERPLRRAHRTSIVGRDADLAQLRLVALRAFEEGRPYLVSIVAPAGVGKSRLVEAFIEEVERPVSGGPAPLVAVAQCLPYGQRLTYWPLRALALAIIELPDDTPPDALRPAFERWLTDAGDPTPGETATDLAATLGAIEVDASDRLAIHAAWRRFVELAAERRPLVLVIEDVHWSSDSLLDLIDAILAPHGDVPMVMVALARPELLDRRPSWGGGRRNAVSLALEPLRDRAVEALVRDLLPDPDPAVVAAVLARAEGNPFYVGEIVRSLLERAGPTPDVATRDTAIASLPDSVHGTVLARLDAVPPDARRCVQLGAVIGRSFPAAAVTALEPRLAGDVLATALDVLVERDFIRPSGVGTCTFRHILIREVAYGTLPRAERARLHALAGEFLEAQANAADRGDELAELVAFHFREAATLRAASGLDPDPALTERAVSWLTRAADTAMAGAATLEAARHLAAAADLSSGIQRALIDERIGYIRTGGEQALRAFERAYATAREAGADPATLLRLRAGAGLMTGRWIGTLAVRPSDAQQHELIREIRGLREGVEDNRALLVAALAETFLRSASGDDPATFADVAAEALERATLLGDVDLLSASLDAMTYVSFRDPAGRLHEALAHAERRASLAGISIAERSDAITMLAWTRNLMGDMRGSADAARQVRAMLGPGQEPGFQLGSTAWLVDALAWLGEWDEALVQASRLMDLWTESEIPAPKYALNGFTRAWWISRSRGEVGRAAEWEDATRRILQEDAREGRLHLLLAVIDGEQDLGRVVDKWSTFATSMRLDHPAWALTVIADELRGPADMAALRDIAAGEPWTGAPLLRAGVDRLTGLAEQDEEALVRALTAFEHAGTRPAAARVRAELGTLRGDRGLVDDALRVLEGIGDVRHLERVERRWGAR